MSNIGMTAAGRVLKAREQTRPTARDHIINIFDFFFELSGDRSYGNDKSIVCGIARLDSRPVTVIGQQKGRTLEENMEMRFGMPDPEGYRKAMRMMKQAEKFRRPVITFIDTPGAFPGKEAEERGQGMAIAECIEMMSRLKVPCISVFIGEGGSGGALALAVSDRTIMEENAIFSILSPEGFASILWRDTVRWEEAAEAMKLTAQDLMQMGICDEIVHEKDVATEAGRHKLYADVKRAISDNLEPLLRMSGEQLTRARYKKLRSVGIR